MYGEDIVFNRFKRQISQELRASVIRSMTTAQKNKKPLQAAADAAAAGFKPEVTSGATRALKAMYKSLENLDSTERETVLKALGLLPGNGSDNEADSYTEAPREVDALASA